MSAYFINNRLPDHASASTAGGFFRGIVSLATALFCFSAMPPALALVSDTEIQTPGTEFISETPEIRWTAVTVQKNDSLSRIFNRNKLKTTLAIDLSRKRETKLMHVLLPGDEFMFARDSKGKLLGIEFRRAEKHKLIILMDDGDFSVVNKNETKRIGSLQALLNKLYLKPLQDEAKELIVLLPDIDDTEFIWRSVKIRPGDTLSHIFVRLGLPRGEAVKVANAPNDNFLRSGLRPGQKFRIATYKDGKFAVLEFPKLNDLKIHTVISYENRYFVGFRNVKTEVQEHYACSEIKFNLYNAAKKLNIPPRVIDAYAELFASRIDFSRQTHRGDEFCVIYMQRYLKGTPINSPEIVSASYRQENNVTKVFLFVDTHGRKSYYDQFGFNIQEHFLKAPLKLGRVTSVFSANRYHPVLKVWRKHLGVDYGARRGTPVMATADGFVVKKTRMSGYGKVIILKHGNKFSTLYAHLNSYAKGIHAGRYVQQGQVIGFVGSTGTSTSPHLHYEFRVYGRHKDPLKYPMPKGKPIGDENRKNFNLLVLQWSDRLEKIDEPILAYNPRESSQ